MPATPAPDSTSPLSRPDEVVTADLPEAFQDLDQDLLSMDSGESLDGNPWLSWSWADPEWDVLEFLPPAPVPNAAESSIEHANDIQLDQFQDGEVQHIEKRLRCSISSMVDAKIDPLENHRQAILAHLETASFFTGRDKLSHWLSRSEFPALLKTYFMRHHRHTPIIHLATFSIAETTTPLIYAMALMAAAYTPSLRLRANDIVFLIQSAYKLALDAAEVSQDAHPVPPDR